MFIKSKVLILVLSLSFFDIFYDSQISYGSNKENEDNEWLDSTGCSFLFDNNLYSKNQVGKFLKGERFRKRSTKMNYRKVSPSYRKQRTRSLQKFRKNREFSFTDDEKGSRFLARLKQMLKEEFVPKVIEDQGSVPDLDHMGADELYEFTHSFSASTDSPSLPRKVFSLTIDGKVYEFRPGGNLFSIRLYRRLKQIKDETENKSDQSESELDSRQYNQDLYEDQDNVFDDDSNEFHNIKENQDDQEEFVPLTKEEFDSLDFEERWKYLQQLSKMQKQGRRILTIYDLTDKTVKEKIEALDKNLKISIAVRLSQLVRSGRFGSSKSLISASNLYELKFRDGLRLYYAFDLHDSNVLYIINVSRKDDQQKEIERSIKKLIDYKLDSITNIDTRRYKPGKNNKR